MENPLLKTVLIYENFAAGVSASWFCQSLAWALDCALEGADVELRCSRDSRSPERRRDCGKTGRSCDCLCIGPHGVTRLGAGVAGYVAPAARRRASRPCSIL